VYINIRKFLVFQVCQLQSQLLCSHDTVLARANSIKHEPILNVRLHTQLSINLVAMLSAAVGALYGGVPPLNVLQLLWGEWKTSFV
jgi:hypothetical protein